MGGERMECARGERVTVNLCTYMPGKAPTLTKSHQSHLGYLYLFPNLTVSRAHLPLQFGIPQIMNDDLYLLGFFPPL
jgi:hypothetical protein